MDKKSNNVALLSIHPKYADAILDGSKTVEFRKRFNEKVETVVIYSTMPVGKIVGCFDINKVYKEYPRQLWTEFGDKGAISQESFFDYYDNTDNGVALEVKNVRSFDSPLELESIGVKKAPQSYQYLPPTCSSKLLCT